MAVGIPVIAAGARLAVCRTTAAKQRAPGNRMTRGIPPDIGMPSFLRGTMSTEIEQMLDTVAANRDLWQLFGGAPADLDERVAALRLTSQNAGRAAREELGLPDN